MKNQMLNSVDMQMKGNMLVELESISRANLIVKVDEVIEFLLKVKQAFFPEQDPHLFDQLKLFKADELSKSDLATYGLGVDTKGWYIATPDGSAEYADSEEGIQDLAHTLLLKISEHKKDALNY